jgi:hypothetical protein
MHEVNGDFKQLLKQTKVEKGDKCTARIIFL